MEEILSSLCENVLAGQAHTKRKWIAKLVKKTKKHLSMIQLIKCGIMCPFFPLNVR